MLFGLVCLPLETQLCLHRRTPLQPHLRLSELSCVGWRGGEAKPRRRQRPARCWHGGDGGAETPRARLCLPGAMGRRSPRAPVPTSSPACPVTDWGRGNLSISSAPAGVFWVRAELSWRSELGESGLSYPKQRCFRLTKTTRGMRQFQLKHLAVSGSKATTFHLLSVPVDTNWT